jgi:hypothetical protein
MTHRNSPAAAGPMVPATPKGFYTTAAILDLTSVNGTPVKGVAVYTQSVLNLTTNPSPGQAISDITRGNTITGISSFSNPTERRLVVSLP